MTASWLDIPVPTAVYTFCPLIELPDQISRVSLSAFAPYVRRSSTAYCPEEHSIAVARSNTSSGSPYQVPIETRKLTENVSFNLCLDKMTACSKQSPQEVVNFRDWRNCSFNFHLPLFLLMSGDAKLQTLHNTERLDAWVV